MLFILILIVYISLNFQTIFRIKTYDCKVDRKLMKDTFVDWDPMYTLQNLECSCRYQ